MRLSQVENNVIYYLDVESEYEDPADGKGQKNAVSFVMSHYNINGLEIDSVVNVSVEDARKFATAILKVCDEIEGKKC